MNQKSEVEEIAENIRPHLKEIDPKLTVSVEKMRIEPIQGQSRVDWVLLFKCQDLKFSMEPTTSIDAIRKAFLNASLNKRPADYA